MDKKNYGNIAFWFLVLLNIISLFESIISTEGFSLLKEPEFQNLLLLAILKKLANRSNENAFETDSIIWRVVSRTLCIILTRGVERKPLHRVRLSCYVSHFYIYISGCESTVDRQHCCKCDCAETIVFIFLMIWLARKITLQIKCCAIYNAQTL